ncbi:MAG: hypothetical protein ACRDGQ_07375 [Candidatus Limnocylindrales bacterium]
MFLIGAALSVLVVRSLLAAADYPQVGGGGLHIAHMLWGGLLMLGAIVALLTFVDRRVEEACAVVAGVGFGIFIDEIGKFLTSDSNYFFRPAIALIYIMFIGLFLLARAVLAGPALDPRGSLANAMDLLKDGLDGTLDERSRTHAILLLRQSPDTELSRSLATFAAGLTDRPPSLAWARRVVGWLDAGYERLAANPLFDRVLVVAVGIYAVGSVVAVGLLIFSQGAQVTTVATAVQGLATLAGSLLILRGIPDLFVSRRAAFQWFRRGILVWILVAQIFVFYTSQLAGIAGLIVDLSAYGLVRYVLSREIAAAVRANPSTSATRK